MGARRRLLIYIHKYSFEVLFHVAVYSRAACVSPREFPPFIAWGPARDEGAHVAFVGVWPERRCCIRVHS